MYLQKDPAEWRKGSVCIHTEAQQDGEGSGCAQRGQCGPHSKDGGPSLLAESLRITYIRLPNHLGHEDVVRAGGCEGVGEIQRRGQHWGQEYGRKSAGTQGRSRGCHTITVLGGTYSNSVAEDSHLHESARHTHQLG